MVITYHEAGLEQNSILVKKITIFCTVYYKIKRITHTQFEVKILDTLSYSSINICLRCSEEKVQNLTLKKLNVELCMVNKGSE